MFQFSEIGPNGRTHATYFSRGPLGPNGPLVHFWWIQRYNLEVYPPPKVQSWQMKVWFRLELATKNLRVILEGDLGFLGPPPNPQGRIVIDYPFSFGRGNCGIDGVLRPP